MVATAIWKKFEREDERYYKLMEGCLRRSKMDLIDGYGIVKLPKYGWI
jgi:hypothetical protein